MATTRLDGRQPQPIVPSARLIVSRILLSMGEPSDPTNAVPAVAEIPEEGENGRRTGLWSSSAPERRENHCT